ncbi:MAG TPA: class A beta-lactamase [Pyrinomonadaceae bacterium]|nr:class A beta-lactamase [Pyrinomonadaceae bacterium]
MRKIFSTFFVLVMVLSIASCGTPVVPVNEIVNPSIGELVFKEDEELQEKLAALAPEAKGKLGVFALLMEDERSVSFNGSEHFAMQSVVKLPVSMLVMQQVAEGKFTLDQKVKFTTDDLVPSNMRSPLRDKNPKGGEVTVNELIRLALVESDGSACDILTRIAGGTAAVQAFVRSIGISDMQMKRTHKEFRKSWDFQYENWATPEGAAQLLTRLFPVQPTQSDWQYNLDATYDLIYQRMLESIPGQNRLKAQLPPGTPIAHKTGTGGTKDGVTSATNDIGIITLPSGKHVAIAVFVGDSSADEKTRELVIAKVAKAVWDTWSGVK